MKFKAYTGITWSLLELAGLLEDEDSHVFYEKIKKHLGLHPFHLTNLNAALDEILSSRLNSHDPELNGFLLAYKNPKLLTTLGDIFYDSCFIHVDIEADFYVFRPKVGYTLKGIVNKKGFDHIGVIVHKAFNVSIPKTDNAEEWPGHLVEIGQEVKFKITHFDLTTGLPFIRGFLNPENYLEGCKLHNIKKKRRRTSTITTNEPFYSTNIESNDSCDINVEISQSLSPSKKLTQLEKQVSPEKYSKKKKRHLNDSDTRDEENKKHSKKRLKVSEELNDTEFEIDHNESCKSFNDDTNTVNNIDTGTKKRKKHEKTSKKKSLAELEISDSEFDYSTVSIKVEKDLTSNSDSEIATEIELKRHKKRSKRESKKMEYPDDANSSIANEEILKNVKLEHKKHSKKLKLADSDINDSRVEIKLEGSSKSNNTTELSLDKNNHNNVSDRRKSSEKHIKKSITDSESEFGNISVKVEKNTSESEHTQDEGHRKEKILKVIKTEKSENKSRHSRDDTQNENCLNGLQMKHKKKRKEASETEQEFKDVTIKQEKLNDHSLIYSPKSKKSSKDKYIDNSNQNVKDEYDTLHTNKIKKSKVTDSESELQETRIKVEKQKIKSEFKDKEEKYSNDSRAVVGMEETAPSISPRKHSKHKSVDRDVKVLKNYQSDSSIMEEPMETKDNVFSPRKISKKCKKSECEILVWENRKVRIKSERSLSEES